MTKFKSLSVDIIMINYLRVLTKYVISFRLIKKLWIGGVYRNQFCGFNADSGM